MNHEFDLSGQDFIELCNLLKVSGACQTGGHAKLEISEGLVKVDGAQELRKRCKIRVNQVVEYEDFKIKVIDTK
jgi:ribosome-associated protein